MDRGAWQAIVGSQRVAYDLLNKQQYLYYTYICSMYMYYPPMYIYVCVCVCVCVFIYSQSKGTVEDRLFIHSASS